MGFRRFAMAHMLAGLFLAVWGVPGVADDLRPLCASGAKKGDVVVCARAVDQSPNDVQTRWDYARALYVAGQYDPAIEQYRAAAAIAPDSPRAHFELAGSLASLKRYGEAVEPIQYAMRLKSDDIMIYRVAAIVFRQVGWPQLALDANIHSAKLGDRLAIYELSQMYSLGIGVERDPDKAVKWLTKAAESGHVAAMDQMVRVYLQGELGQNVDHDKAEQWAQRARNARQAFN